MHYLEAELTNQYGFSSTLMDKLSNNVFSGIWFWDLENPEEEFFDDRFWTTLGYDPKDMPAKSNAWQAMVYEEDLKEAYRLVEEHLTNPKIPYRQVLRYKHKQGHTIYIHCTGHAIIKDSKPIRLLGVHFEITKQYLRLKNLESFFSLNHDLALLLDQDGLIIDANQSASEKLIIAKEEIGKVKLKEKLALNGYLLKDVRELFNQSASISNTVGNFKLKFSLIPNEENYLFLAHDLTEEFNLNQQLTRLGKLNKALFLVSEGFITKDFNKEDYWEIIQASLTYIAYAVKTDEIVLFSYENLNKQEVNKLFSLRLDENGREIINKSTKSYPSTFFKAWHEKHSMHESLFVDDVKDIKQEEVNAYLKSSDTTTYLAIPLVISENLVGFIEYKWHKKLQDAKELIPNLRLFNKLINEYWQYLGIHSKLKIQEHATGLVLESINAPIAIIDLKTRVINSNTLWDKLFNITTPKVDRTIDLVDLLELQGSKSLVKSLKKIEENGNERFKVKISNKHQTEDYELSLSILKQESLGTDIQVIVELRNQSEINLLNEASIEIKQLSSFLLEESPLFILRYSASDYQINLANKKAQALLKENPWINQINRNNHPFREHQASSSNRTKSVERIETAVTFNDEPISVEWDILEDFQNPKSPVIWAFGKDNTVFHNAQLKINRKTKELQKTQSLANIGNYNYDIKNDLFEWSDETYRILELNIERTTNPPNHFTFIHEDDRELVNDTLDLARNGDMEFYSSYKILTSKGNIKHIEDRCEIEFDPIGEPIFYRGVIKDITSYKDRQNQLAQLNRELTKANFLLRLNASVSKVLESEIEDEKKADKILKLMSGLPNILNISLLFSRSTYRSTPQQSTPYEIVRKYAKDKSENFKPIPIKKTLHFLPFDLTSDLLGSDGISSNGILNAKKIRKGLTLFDELSWSGKNEVYLISINVNNNLKIIFCLEAKESFKWDETIINNLRKLTNTIKQSYELKEYINTLAESEERFKLINKVSQSVIWEHDLESDLIKRGDGIEMLLGPNSSSEIATEGFESRIHPDDKVALFQNFLQMKNGEREIRRFEFRAKHAMGHYVHIEDMAIAVKNKEGKVIKIIGSMMDRSSDIEQKSLFRTAGELAKLATIDIDIESGQLKNISQNLADIFDLEINQLNLNFPRTKFFDNKSKQWVKSLNVFLSPQNAKDFEVRIQTIKSTEKWLRVRSSVILKDGKPFRIFGVIQDITTEKTTHLQMEESIFWLKKTQEVGKIGNFRVNLDNGEWEVSDEIKKSWQIPPDMEFNRLNWLSLIKPQYRQEVEASFKDAVTKGVPYFAIYEAMIGLNPNNTLWIEARGEIVTVDNQRFIIGYTKDITETKALNDRLSLQKEKMQEISWKQSHLARGPLTRLIGETFEALKNTTFNEEALSVLERILLSAQEVDNTLKESNTLVEKLNLTKELKPEIFLTNQKKLSQFRDHNLNLYIVDDDPIICALHQQIIKREQICDNIITVNSGKKLLQKLPLNEDKTLNIILLDINMPEMSGLDVLKSLSESSAKYDTLVIMVSSSISTSDKVECASYPFVLDYYEKPLSKMHLNKLKNILKTIQIEENA